MRSWIVVSLLLGFLSVIHAADPDVFAPALQGDLTKLEKAISAKADLNKPHPISGLTAWQVSRLHGRNEASDLLAKAGADTKRAFPPPEETLDRALKAGAKPDAPGLALLVARDGKIVFEKGYGLANIEAKRAITPETIFRIGSVTKQFTATAILICEQDGKLKTADTLDKFYPGFPRGDKITLHHLLTHTSGIKSFTGLPGFMKHVTENRTPDEMIARFRDEPPDFEPGKNWSYCNSGYFLLGEIVGQAAGKPYGDLLRDRVFMPAGMTRTGIHRPGLNLPDEAHGYARAGDKWKPAVDWNMSQAGGAGEIYSTVGDLFRWNEAIHNARALTAESLTKAHTPSNVDGKSELGGMGKDYGYGWVIAEKRGLKAIWHNGGLDGFSSLLMRFPDQKVTLAALANTMTPSREMSPDEAINLAARIFLWEQMKPQPCTRETALPEGVELADYAGTFDFITVGVMRFRANDGKLQGKLAAQQWGDLQPAGKDVFREPDVDATFEFQRDDKGAVSSVKLLQRGFNFIGPRFTEFKEGKLTPEKLAEIAGTYDLGLGKFVLRTKPKGGALAGNLGEQPAFDFVPVDGSENRLFSHAIRVDLEFKRNDEGKISEMILHQGGLSLPGKRVEKESK